MRLISVVMGEPSQDARTNDTVALLNYGKSAYKPNTILESGEIQLTDYGISGICIFNLSSKIVHALALNKKVHILVNFATFTDNFYSFLENRSNKLKSFNISEILEGLFHYKLIQTILKYSQIDGHKTWQSLNENEKRTLVNNFTNLKLNIIGSNSFDKAQCCTGGISLKEINPKNMQCQNIPNICLTGELLDVDGICGGFNLAFAFMTGYLAGKEIAND